MVSFGQGYANEIRRCCSQPSDKWHLDEVELKIKGQKYYLWRAVDSDDNVLDISNAEPPRHESCNSSGNCESRKALHIG